jgi:hypothetical protein
MGSVFPGLDKKQSSDLLVEINARLQALLEDTLVKNITLKVCSLTIDVNLHIRRILTHWAKKYRDCRAKIDNYRWSSTNNIVNIPKSL